MTAKEIKKGVYWVGVLDWNLRDFHGYKTSRGSSYNAYLVVDEKIALIDTVKEGFTEEMLHRISSVVSPEKIDYIVCNHVEMDHSGAIPEMHKIAPKAKILASPKGEQGLKNHFGQDLPVEIVKAGDSISLGKTSLEFYPIPMVHWPDSMMTYVPERKLLLPNDAFGQHFAFENLFDDENSKGIVFEEALKYYANIVWPYSKQVQKVVKTVSSLDIDMVAPSHGVIWRESVSEIFQKYDQWSKGLNKEKALIIYDSMWGSTEKMATSIKLCLDEKGIPTNQRKLSVTDISDIAADLLEAKYVFIGSPNLNTNMMPTLGGLFTYLKGLRPHKKQAMSFGSFGWGTQATKQISIHLEELGWDQPAEAVTNKYIPGEDILPLLKTAVDATLKA